MRRPIEALAGGVTVADLFASTAPVAFLLDVALVFFLAALFLNVGCGGHQRLVAAKAAQFLFPDALLTPANKLGS
jgi:hypothetical protein